MSSSPWTSTWSTPGTSRTALHARSAPSSTRATITSDPIERFSSVGVPSVMRRPWLMMPTRSASSSASSRYCVVRKIVMPSALRRRTSSHTRTRLAGSRPVVGSSRNSDLRVVDERGREVEAPPHPTRVGADAVPERGADVDELRELPQPLLDLRLREPVEAALEAQQLDAALGGVERRFLERDADAQPHVDGLAGDVEAGDLGPPGGRQEQRAQHVHERRLARAVGTEEAVDLARLHLEVDAVDGAGLAEEPPQLLGSHRRVGHGGPTYRHHGSSIGGLSWTLELPRSHRAASSEGAPTTPCRDFADRYRSWSPAPASTGSGVAPVTASVGRGRSVTPSANQTVAAHSAVAPATWMPTSSGGDPGEVLRVADAGLRDEHDEQHFEPAYDRVRSARAVHEQQRHEHQSEEHHGAGPVDADDVGDEQVEARGPLRRARHVAGVRPGTGDDRPRDDDDRAARTSTRLIQRTDGATIGTGRCATGVGLAARRHSTRAFASSTIDTRKWLITNGGESSLSTTSLPSTICTITPATRPSESSTRSVRRGARTSDPSTATITASETSPVTVRFTNSTMAWKSFAA